jgi:LysR family transcriptional regulator, low CO2-responsive transcriptional regulator
MAQAHDKHSLPHLATFALAAETCSFTATAKSLRLTQSAVSQRIQELELSLKTQLFTRRGGRLELTSSGRTLYEYAQKILKLHAEAGEEITGKKSVPAGDLNIAASSVPGEHLLPALLDDFVKQFPQLRVRVSVSDSNSVFEQIATGKVSIGLVGRLIENPHLKFRYLASDKMLLAVPPGHPLSRKKKVTSKELTQYPLILRETGSGMRHCFEAALDRINRSLSDFRIVLELGSNEAMKKAVLGKTGLAVLSQHAIQEELESGRLKSVTFADLQCDRNIYVITDDRRVLNAPARMFLHFLDNTPIP